MTVKMTEKEQMEMLARKNKEQIKAALSGKEKRAKKPGELTVNPAFYGMVELSGGQISDTGN